MNDDGSQSFSYRMGIERKKEIQIDFMDDELHTRIWNTMYKFYFSNNSFYEGMHVTLRSGGEPITRSEIIEKVFGDFFKEDVGICRRARDIRNRFEMLEWNQVYDFVEFMMLTFPDGGHLRNKLNRVLEAESAGYRVIGDKVTPITNELEMDEVAKARSTVTEVNKHVESAISLLSNKDNPDPHNAIKEAISAVEALCKKITGDNNATLGRALSKIQANDPKPVDPNLEEAIRKLYNFSSDASGVRHSHAEGKTQVGFDEAKFMVVICSTIVNYLVKHADSIEPAQAKSP